MPEPELELRYFPLLARGLGPTLVLFHAGIPFHGNASLDFQAKRDWKDFKPQTPFGQLPVLRIKRGSDYDIVGQTCAIISYIGDAHPAAFSLLPTNSLFNMQLICFAEEIYGIMDRTIPTIYKRLSEHSAAGSIFTTKGTREQYDRAVSDGGKFRERLSRLATFLESHATNGSGDSNFLPGELYLFSTLYQLNLVEPSLISSTSIIQIWYAKIEASSKTQKVLSGETPMGILKQYFVHPDSPLLCSVSDEREES
mmetsp:Transcript_16260/g.33451  ORF Transcript_16260/g.33451 Transcript_16260/m.33451 type:complete len:254 (+) Transcript_16260:45-806(+)